MNRDADWIAAAQSAVMGAAAVLVPIVCATAEAPELDATTTELAATIRKANLAMGEASSDAGGVRAELLESLTALEDALSLAGSLPFIKLTDEAEQERVAALGAIATLLASSRANTRN
jgi:hypothetical protein